MHETHSITLTEADFVLEISCESDSEVLIVRDHYTDSSVEIPLEFVDSFVLALTRVRQAAKR